MKIRIVALVTIAMATFLSSKGQSSTDFIPIPDNAKWLYACTLAVINPTPPVTYEYEHSLITVGADTTINLESYRILNRQILGEFDIEIVGAFRQDIIAKKVYGYSFDQGEEFVMYDFDIQNQDTIWCETLFNSSLNAGLSGGNFDILDSTSSVLPNFQVPSSTPVYYFNKEGWINRAIWVEGIGNLFYFGDPCASWGEFLTCDLQAFCDGDSTWRPWPSACHLNVGANNSPLVESPKIYWDGKEIVFKTDAKLLQLLNVYSINGVRLKNTGLTKVSRNHYAIKWLEKVDTQPIILHYQLDDTTYSKLLIIN